MGFSLARVETSAHRSRQRRLSITPPEQSPTRTSEMFRDARVTSFGSSTYAARKRGAIRNLRVAIVPRRPGKAFSSADVGVIRLVLSARPILNRPPGPRRPRSGRLSSLTESAYSPGREGRACAPPGSWRDRFSRSTGRTTESTGEFRRTGPRKRVHIGARIQTIAADGLQLSGP